MLKLIALFIGIAHAQTVNAQQYLIFANQPACQARAQQQCQALGCDGKQTIYWWDCSTGPLSAGTVGATAVAAGSYAMAIQPSGIYSISDTTTKGSGTLTPSEQSSLVSAAAIAPVLPVQTGQAVQ
jgi:hypothetical protein